MKLPLSLHSLDILPIKHVLMISNFYLQHCQPITDAKCIHISVLIKLVSLNIFIILLAKMYTNLSLSVKNVVFYINYAFNYLHIQYL